LIEESQRKWPDLWKSQQVSYSMCQMKGDNIAEYEAG